MVWGKHTTDKARQTKTKESETRRKIEKINNREEEERSREGRSVLRGGEGDWCKMSEERWSAATRK